MVDSRLDYTELWKRSLLKNKSSQDPVHVALREFTTLNLFKTQIRLRS